MTRSFGLTARSALHALKSDAEKFKEDVLNEDLARVCAIKAWHLCDHVSNEVDSNSKFTKLKCLRNHVKQACPELAYLQDICNASKHAKIKKYTPPVDEARLIDGDFSHLDFDPRDFDVPRLEVKLRDGQSVLFGDVLDRAINFWTNFFDDNGIE